MNTQTATTIDAREWEYYNRLADTWWDRQGPFWPLHKLNELRVAWIRDAICARFGLDGAHERPLQGLSILDIGCGGGILSVSLARLGASVHGIDVVERNIVTARRHVAGDTSLTSLPLRFDSISAEGLAATGMCYDAVLSMEVVEHVADLPTFMQSNCRLVSPGGLLFVSTINRTWRSYLFAILGAEYVLGWLPRGTHEWTKFRRPGELDEMLSDEGFRIAARSGVAVNPVTRQFRLTKSLAVNYMLMATHDLSGAPSHVSL